MSAAVEHSAASNTDAALSILLTAIAEALWDWNLLTGEVIFSSQYQQLLGYSDNQFGHHLDEWIQRLHPDDAKPAMAHLRAHIDGHASLYQHEQRLLCKNGNWKWVRARGSIVARDNQGRPSRMLGLIAEINNEHQQQAKQSLSDAMLKNFSQHLPHSFFYQFQRFSDGHFCFPYASVGVGTLFGLKPEQIKEDASALFQLIHPDDLEPLRQAIRSSASSLQNWHQEYRIMHGSEERWVMGDAHPEAMADGSVLWHGFLSDITEQKRIQKKLQDSDQQMQLIMRASNQGLFDFNVQTGRGSYSAVRTEMRGRYPKHPWPEKPWEPLPAKNSPKR